MSKNLNRARQLRQQQTDHERFMWRKLRNRRFAQFKFRRQVPLGNYIVDFICFDSRLIIELDGGQHNVRREYDARRTSWLEEQGFRVVRFWNFEILEETDGVEELILRRLQEAAKLHTDPSPPAPLPQGERGGRSPDTSLNHSQSLPAHPVPLAPRGRGVRGEGKPR